jgi:acyl carrier protein
MKINQAAILKVVRITVDKLGVDASRLTYGTSFSGDLGADYLEVYELLMAFEDEFKITIKDDEAEKLTTIGAVIEFLNDRLSEPYGNPNQKAIFPNSSQRILII